MPRVGLDCFVTQKGKQVLSQYQVESLNILAIGQSLTSHHSDFFLRRGTRSVLTMTTLAQELNLHPSTVSRAIRNKYLQYPAGVCPIRSMFVQGGFSASDSTSHSPAIPVARDNVEACLRSLIDSEDKRHPRSDQQLYSRADRFARERRFLAQNSLITW
jgi:RNA polymerase sigma-54 factor